MAKFQAKLKSSHYWNCVEPTMELVLKKKHKNQNIQLSCIANTEKIMDLETSHQDKSNGYTNFFSKF